MAGLLWTIITVLFVFWLLGVLIQVGGGLIHLLLIAAIILVVVDVLTRWRAAA
jgi:hypothetical protein